MFYVFENIIILLIILFILSAPMNGVADGAQKGAENPGLYENLPFHGLQQAPNKVNFIT